MTDRIELIRLLSKPLQKEAALRLALVVERTGSAPCTVGDLLLLDHKNKMNGTVGGGRLEQQVLEDLHHLAPDQSGQLRRFNLLPEQDGMTCGGSVTILLARLTEAARTCFANLNRCLQQGQPARLQVAVDTDGHVTWLGPDQVVAGGQLFEVLVAPAPELLLFGAGHIAQVLAPMAHLTGFAVTVLDDRTDYLADHSYGQGIAVVELDCFEHALADRKADASSFLLIATYSHTHDLTVLAQALDTGAGYIGMVGSRRKREELFGQLRRTGFSETDLARVRCPVGLAIKAETPAEIAVSILAEMIAVRRCKQ